MSRGRGVITKRKGRRLTVQFRSGVVVERDQRYVHPIDTVARTGRPEVYGDGYIRRVNR